MSVFWTYLSLIYLIVPSCTCGDILAIMPAPSHSHQVAFAPLWKELSLRGHKVTVITTDPQNDPKLKNLKEIDIRSAYKFMAEVMKTIQETEITMWNTIGSFIDVSERMVDEILSQREIRDLMKPGKKFDVVLVEVFYPELLAFAEIYNCPKILVSPMEINSFIHRLVGNPTHPVILPEFLTPFYGDLSFKERVISTIFDRYLEHCTSKKLFRSKDYVLQKHFNTSSTVAQLISEVDLIFLNTNPVLLNARALGPSTITIGGQQRITSMETLSQDLQQFLDGAKEGFIYFSLGSNVKSKDLKKETLTAIIEALRQLPYKVLWKFEADELPGKPDNVKLIKWTPQQSVLAHPNIKLFITQGGLQSMEEAIYSEVPLVVMPFFGDQEQNAKLMVSKGIAVRVDVRPYLDKENLKKAIIEVISNPKYKNAIIRLKQLALDTPMTGLEKAVWWTEYVIRNKGAKHLRNPAADIPLYQYYLLDVIGFLIFVFVAAISVILFSVRFLLRFIASKLGLKKVSASKKLN